MSRAEAVEAYRAAHKKAQKAYREDVDRGRWPYPQVLDDLLEGKSIAGRIELGVMQIPTDRVVGTVSAGRRAVFSRDFMPLPEMNTEFGAKWTALCEAHLDDEGIRDPIRCYEYFGDFYVQEGNKRLSVMRYFDAPSVPASVMRIVPAYADDPDTKLYYEFLEFYHLSRTYAFRFTKPGSYRKLVAALGFEPDEVWTEERRRRVISAFTRFSEAAAHVKFPDGVGLCDAFLAWISVYSIDDLSALSPETLLASLNASVTDAEADVTVSTEADAPASDAEPAGKTLLARLYNAMFLPTHLQAAFIHEFPPETSGWIRGHEQGRLSAEQALSGKVTTRAYIVDEQHNADSLFREAVTDGAQVIFATTPSLIDACRRAAAAYPNVKILNCSVAMPYPGVRTYYSRIYETKFLAGVIAGACSHSDLLGYVASAPIFGVPAGINAFALGARLVNPRAVVKLRWSCVEADPLASLLKDGVDVVSNHEWFAPEAPQPPFGLIRIPGDGSQESLAATFWNWGAFYEKLLADLLLGHWEDESANRSAAAINYWWGMQSGVIGVTPSEKLPEGIRALVEALKGSIVEGRLDPFRRVMSDQEGIVRNDGSRWLSPAEILHMDWLSDTIEGRIPTFDELLPVAQSIVRLLGVYREAIPPVKDGPIL
ncbi:MAG: BMP family ABC transporter substrate-binding protein [Clostridia bacterium]|nr:BMP family ABC transporter substrate-binding protein [Clostridia bacterium]